MQTINNGSVPGAVTPIENDEGLVAGQATNPKKIDNNGADFTATFIAIYTRIKATVSDIYIDRGIGADTLLMIALALVYGYGRWTA